MKESHDYDDIIDLPHHVSETRKRMSAIDRAAQFSPFAALTGYEDAVKETARLTDARIELDENRKSMLNEVLQYVLEHIADMPEVRAEHFVKDSHKSGGAYVIKTARVKRIDPIERRVVFTDNTSVSIDDIYDIRLCPPLEDTE